MLIARGESLYALIKPKKTRSFFFTNIILHFYDRKLLEEIVTRIYIQELRTRDSTTAKVSDKSGI